MSAKHVEFDFSEFRAFFDRLRQAASGDFKKYLALFIEGLGFEFLRIVEDEIIRREVMDTRLLLNSFHKGGDGNVWELSDGDLTLEVGTNVPYAKWVNDGHWTVDKDGKNALRDKDGNIKLFDGKMARFVPGHWFGDRFIYDRKAKTGMVLKQQWVEGAHYWESAVQIIEKIFPALLDAKMQQWIDSYFSDFV
jgi:hypothetical protein